MSRKKRSAKTMKKKGGVSPASLSALLQQATTHHQAGRLAEALQGYRRVLEHQPDQPQALDLAGAASYQLGGLEDALGFLKKAISLTPDDASPHYHLGLTFQALGEHGEAVAALRRAVDLNPGFADALNSLGIALKDTGGLEEAEKTYRRALEARPDFSEAHYNLGFVLQVTDRWREAAEAYEKAVAARPGNVEALYNLGVARQQLERLDGAESAFRNAIRQRPQFMEAHSNLAVVLQDRNKLDEALSVTRHALTLQPDFAELHYNLGTTLQKQGRVEEAVSAYRRAVALDPNHAKAQYNLGITLLMSGNLKEGWRGYQWRWRKENATPRAFPQAPWDGSPLAGKTILVWGEQGIGDELRFAGLAPDLTAQGAEVILECEPRLQPLFARSFAQTTCVARTNPTDPFLLSGKWDFQAPAGELARFLRPDLKSFPQHKGYLKADPEQTRELRERYKSGDDLVVGISWSSSATAWNITWPPLEDWFGILETPGATFVNLQYGDTAADRAAFLEHTGVTVIHDDEIDPLTHMDGFAAQVAAMDLVVSIGNSTVEVAGALGVPVWSLVQFEPNWVWMLEREDSPWYPSVRLFRQPAWGDWGTVMARMAEELRQNVKAS